MATVASFNQRIADLTVDVARVNQVIEDLKVLIAGGGGNGPFTQAQLDNFDSQLAEAQVSLAAAK